MLHITLNCEKIGTMAKYDLSLQTLINFQNVLEMTSQDMSPKSLNMSQINVFFSGRHT